MFLLSTLTSSYNYLHSHRVNTYDYIYGITLQCLQPECHERKTVKSYHGMTAALDNASSRPRSLFLTAGLLSSVVCSEDERFNGIKCVRWSVSLSDKSFGDKERSDASKSGIRFLRIPNGHTRVFCRRRASTILAAAGRPDVCKTRFRASFAVRRAATAFVWQTETVHGRISVRVG